MHDFRKFVITDRNRRAGDEEVVTELASHLEEMYTDLRQAGVPEERAIVQITAVGKKLGPLVRRLRWKQEGGWKKWVRASVIPGIVLSIIYGLCKALLVDFYWERAFSLRETSLVMICVVLGFLASSFSRELGGGLLHRRWAATLVVAPYAIVWCVMAFLVTPMQVAQGAAYRPWTIGQVAIPLLWDLLWVLVIPAAGLAIGGFVSAVAFSATSPDLPKREIA
jgi:hypothetical protein